MAKPEEDVAKHGREPVDAVLDTPGKPEEPEGNEDGANVRKREAELGERVAVVPGCELVVHSVDSGHNEENRNEKSCAEAEVHQADTGGGVPVAVGAPDVFKVCVETVICAKQDSLVYSHRKDDGLRKKYPEGP